MALRLSEERTPSSCLLRGVVLTRFTQNEAWATSQLILFAPDAPIEPKLFAAQTFRSKVHSLAFLTRKDK